MKQLLIAIMLLSSEAWATGGTYCTVDDEKVKMNVSLTNGRMFGSPVVPRSTIALEIKKPAVKELAKYTFEKGRSAVDDEIPYWFNFNGEMKLAAYALPNSTDDSRLAEIAVIIDTQAEGPFSYKGTYTVTQAIDTVENGYQRFSYEGKITCMVE